MSNPRTNGNVVNPILDNCLLLTIQTKGIGNSKSVSADLVTDEEFAKRISVSKKLLESPELKAINAHFSSLASYLKKRCINSYFKRGMYCCPINRVEEVAAKLDMFKTELPELVYQFANVYEFQVDKSRNDTELGRLFSEQDYHTLEYIQNAFGIEWTWLEIRVPDSLNRVSPDLYKEAKAQMQAKWQEASAQISLALRAQVQDILAKMVDKLTPDSGGKKKIIRSDNLEKVRELISDFQELNITNDRELESIIQQVSVVMAGVDCVELRSNAAEQMFVRQSFETINKQLEGMMVDHPLRAISWEDE